MKPSESSSSLQPGPGCLHRRQGVLISMHPLAPYVSQITVHCDHLAIVPAHAASGQHCMEATFPWRCAPGPGAIASWMLAYEGHGEVCSP